MLIHDDKSLYANKLSAIFQSVIFVKAENLSKLRNVIVLGIQKIGAAFL
jgi:hypothetical protein